jgi:hypothetical protein
MFAMPNDDDLKMKWRNEKYELEPKINIEG